MNVLVAIYSPFVMWNIPVEHVERLRREFPSHTFLHANDDDEAERLIGPAEVAFSSQITQGAAGSGASGCAGFTARRQASAACCSRKW